MPRWPSTPCALALGLAVACASGAARADEPAPAPTTPAPTTPAPEPQPGPPAPAPATAEPVPTGPGADATPKDAPAPPAEEPPRALRFGGDLGVVSLPRLVSVDLLVRYKDFAGGLAFEYLPPGIVKFGDKTTLSWMQLAAQARYFVWKPIFVGALVGYQYSRADSEKFGSEIDYLSQGLFVGLRAGVLFTLKNGLALGGDLGVTVPIAPSLSQKPEDVDDSNARKAARTFGEFVMPEVSLFRVGFFY